MHADAGAFPGGVQANDRRILRVGDHLAIYRGRDAAHAVVGGGLDGGQIVDDVYAGEIEGNLAHLGQALHDLLPAQVAQVQPDALPVRADAAPFVDLGLFGAADQVARGQLHLVRGVTLHETLALAVEQVAAFAATGLAQQDTVAVDAGRVILDEFHVHQGHAGGVGDGHAVAGIGQGIGCDLPGAAVAAGGEHHRLSPHEHHLPAEDVQGDKTFADVVLNDHIQGVPF